MATAGYSRKISTVLARRSVIPNAREGAHTDSSFTHRRMGVLSTDCKVPHPASAGFGMTSRYQKMRTVFPTLTKSFTRAASQFASRMQP